MPLRSHFTVFMKHTKGTDGKEWVLPCYWEEGAAFWPWVTELSPGHVPPQLHLQQIGISSLLKDRDRLYHGHSTDIRRYAALWPKLLIRCFAQRTEKNTNCFVLFFFFLGSMLFFKNLKNRKIKKVVICNSMSPK